MAGTRVLLKLAMASAPAPATLGLSAAAPPLHPLFSMPAPGQALAAAQPHTWFLADGAGALGVRGAHPWDIAHGTFQNALKAHGSAVLAAEPDIEQEWAWPRSEGQAFAATADLCQPESQKGAPFDEGPGFGWHLDDAWSGLRAARTEIGDAARPIRIVHLDTGYDAGHAALPQFLAGADLQRNFVEGGNSAVDQTPASGLLTNRGHGTGTIGILAGGDTTPLLTAGGPVPAGFGALGGAPLCEIVPVRIANSVVHFWTSTVAQGIDYAREIGADVLSMSMGGLPSAAWADAVNRAYEAGVVLVCAAGNSFGGLPTSLIVYPARFSRVIAACGVMAKGHPYYKLGGPMEGCVGPASKMATAMAAYTPNIPWLRLGCAAVADMDGAGTSSATPQIAAAAALWLAKNGSGLGRSWQRVEAVRAALFGSAGRNTEGQAPDPYFGRGLLRAQAALAVPVPAAAALQATASDSASFAFLHLLSSAFGIAGAEPKQLQMFQLELTQRALVSPAAQAALPDPDLPPDQIPEDQRRRFFEAILDEGKTSSALRGFLATQLGRKLVDTGAAPVQQPGPQPATMTSGAAIRRRLTVPVPTRRRVRIFATDPGDSNRLATAFINVATIEVPWEKLAPGPTGEYVEVVDVDPASNAAYDPVDLDDPHLLAEDGYAPSEGNPQFHQQMAYAVAMRTIRNFEVALGRRAIWAPRIVRSADNKFVPQPDDGYVQRLRIYPHALREENAYYSPDKKALLFGYFGDDGPSGGRRTIFSCLAHDIVAHETTHALLDGLHPRFQEATNPDVLAFHEAFADVVALFQHFTFPELLRYEIGRLRGDLTQASLLFDLARQFGQALHNGRALREAIDPGRLGQSDQEALRPVLNYADTKEPHMRGAILVAAIFEAFVAIYTRNSEDLFRIATGGTGQLAPGAIHPDLVTRLADTAVDTAQRMLTLCIRALDYMPPVDPTFGDYLRALVTADADLAPDRGAGYRVALAEAFTRRGIYPDDIAAVSPDSLLWQPPGPELQSKDLSKFLRALDLGAYTQSNRQQAFISARENAARLHGWLKDNIEAGTARSLGFDFEPRPDGKKLPFEVHSVRPAQRVTADGEWRTDIVAVITQSQRRSETSPGTPPFRGGCTLLLDRGYDAHPVRYAIVRPIWNAARKARMDDYLTAGGGGPNGLYGTDRGGRRNEPFAMLHNDL